MFLTDVWLKCLFVFSIYFPVSSTYSETSPASIKHIAAETNISCHWPMIGLFWFSRLSFSQSSENCLVTLSNTNITLLPCDLKKSRLLRKDPQKFMIVIPNSLNVSSVKRINGSFYWKIFNRRWKKIPIFLQIYFQNCCLIISLSFLL